MDFIHVSVMQGENDALSFHLPCLRSLPTYIILGLCDTMYL